MKGIWNKILKVDLSEGRCTSETLPDEVYEKFLGGAGMNAYILWRESPRGTTAFDPANRLTFAPGPMQGIKQTGAAKWTRRRHLAFLQPECGLGGHGQLRHRNQGSGLRCHRRSRAC